MREVCGQWPMVLSLDLCPLELENGYYLFGTTWDQHRQAILEHHRRGGIITLCWHMRNPVTGGTAWDLSEPRAVSLILRGGEARRRFLHFLDVAAEYILTLRDDEGQLIPVVFRPFHEAQGSWFWWGGKLCTPEEYQELFRATWLYFTKDRGLTDILWCYSPNGDCGPQAYMERYPGDEFVDILGIDTYEYVGNGSVEEAGVRYMEELKGALTYLTALSYEHEKLMCLSETGLEGLVDPQWWTDRLLPAMKDFPVSYVLTWRNAHDKPGHFYAAWKGFENEADMKAFAEQENIILLDQ